MSTDNSVVAVYTTHTEADQAMKELQRGGVDMHKLSIVGAPESAAVIGGMSALGAGLYSMGIPKDSIVKYETALKTDQFLLIAHGTAADVAEAKDIIETTRPVQSATLFGEVATAVAV